MKNYIVGLLLVGVLFLSSVIYKKDREPTLRKFPVEKVSEKTNSEVPYFYIYIFFSKRNCKDNLKVIDILNDLPEFFIVKGIVPPNELKDEKELREISGAKFKLFPFEKKYKRFLPLYWPTIYGVDNQGIIYFVLPGVPEEKEYLRQFLTEFYYKAYNLLKACRGNCGKR